MNASHLIRLLSFLTLLSYRFLSPYPFVFSTFYLQFHTFVFLLFTHNFNCPFFAPVFTLEAHIYLSVNGPGVEVFGVGDHPELVLGGGEGVVAGHAHFRGAGGRHRTSPPSQPL